MLRRGTACAVLGDGALWIWNWADEHAPGAIQIVDIFHAKHLSTSPRPSTEREPISPTGGGNNAATNSIKAASTTSSPPSAAMPKPAA